MMKKRWTVAALAALMAASALPISALADQDPAAALPALNREEHMKYMNGYADGTFRPDAPIKRSEASQLIAVLLAEKNAGGDFDFIDVPADKWYFDAVNQLTGFNLLSGFPDGTFRPDENITRAQFVTILSRFPHTDIGTDKTFADVPETHWAHEAILTAVAQGWAGGYPDGSFRPDQTITRAEAVTMLNRILGREGDQTMASTANGIRIMPDVPDTHWAYLAMLEAVTEHEYTVTDGQEKWTSFEKEEVSLAEGWHTIGGELFHVNADKQFDRNTTIDGLDLDHNGRYTTGNAELDAMLTAAVASCVTDSMTQEERLRAVYNYAKETFGYRAVSEVDTSVDGWEITQALSMLEVGKGNCYSWSSAFTYLARKVGYNAKAIPGKSVSPTGNESVHAWTEITIDGTPYTFDPQIESVYAKRYNEHYDLYMKEYGKAEWGYKVDAPAPDTDSDSDQTTDTDETPEADASLVELMAKVYGDKPYATNMAQTVLTKGMGADNQSFQLAYFLGSNDLDIETGLASEPMVNAQPHSIVLARFAEGADMEAAKKTVAENVDPRKWICVAVDPEKVIVESVGNTLILIMDNDNGTLYLQNFQAAMQQ